MKFTRLVGFATAFAWVVGNCAWAQPAPGRTAHQNFLEVPQFRTVPLPPEYQGKSAKELEATAVNTTTLPSVNAADYKWVPTKRIWTDQAITNAQQSSVIPLADVSNGTLKVINRGAINFSLQMMVSSNGTSWSNHQGALTVPPNTSKAFPIGIPTLPGAVSFKLAATSASPNVSVSILRSYALSAPEFRPHSDLNDFVMDMESDPMALAAFVQNEIELVDSVQAMDRLNDVSGPQPTAGAISAGEMRRNAYTTYIQRKGSPYEQCNLLVYLLREAGYSAALVDPAGTKMEVLSKRLSNMLHLQLKGFLTSDDNQLTEVNYPWVVFYDQGAGQWRHLFPWIKDTVVEEGFDLYDFLPTQFNTGAKWLDAYLKNDPAVNEFLGGDGSDIPSTMFKKLVEKGIADHGLSIKDVGSRIYDRNTIFSSWSDFPAPFSVKPDVAGAPLQLRKDWVSSSNLYSYIRVGVVDNVGKEIITTNRRGVGITSEIPSGWQRAMEINGRPIYTRVTTPTLTHQGANYSEWALTVQMVIGAFDSMYDERDTVGDGENFADIVFPNAASEGGVLRYKRRLGAIAYPEIYYQSMWPGKYRQAVDGEMVDLTGLAVKVEWRGSSSTANPIVPVSERRLSRTDIAGVNLNLGAVTTGDVEKLRIEANKLSETSIADEKRWDRLGAITHLAGQAYFERVDRLGKELQLLHKCQADIVGLGVTVLKTESEVVTAPRIDMPMYTFPYWNSSLRPDQQASRVEVLRDFSNVLAAELSAQEHSVINDLYHQKDAISSVKLLRIANQSREIVRSGETLPPGPGGDSGLEFRNGFYEMSSADFQSRYVAAEAATASATATTPASVISDLKGVFSRFDKAGNLGLTGSPPDRIPLSNRPAFVQTWSGGPTNADFLAAFGTQAAANTNNVYGNFKTGDSWSKMKAWCDGNPEGKLYITPGPVKGEDSPTKPSYIGWGSLMVGLGGNLAGWIEGNQAAYSNGGFGVNFSSAYSSAFSPTNFSTLSISSFGTNYFLTSPLISMSSSISPTWAGVNSWSPAYNLAPLTNSLQGAYSMGFGGSDRGWAAVYDRGYFGDAEFHRSWDTSSNFVEDPVNIVTGEFYCDEADLSLPGPLPLELRRNYSSQSESNSQLGPGWKLSLMPYLSIAGKNPGEENYDAIEHAGKHKGYLIYAADWDGSVLAFREKKVETTATWGASSSSITVANVTGISIGQFAVPANKTAAAAGTPYVTGINPVTKVVMLSSAISSQAGTASIVTFVGGGPWRIDATDNPGLKNFNGKDVDELNNPFHEQIVRTGSVTEPIYTWYRANGTKATYTWRKFPIKIVESATVSKEYKREMPYLSKIEDLAGNTLDFTFYTNSNAAAGVAVELSSAEVGYGQVKKVRSSNGNFLVFDYDSQQRIRNVYSNDGRRVQYRYDPLGDLVEVELPDAAVHNYEYQHQLAPRPDSRDLSTNSGTDWTVSTTTANTGTRIKGWLQPQETGLYKFQYVGSGEMKVTVASGDDPSSSPAWTQTSGTPGGGALTLQSGSVNLEAGKSYYVETRHFRTGSSTLSLKWQKPGDPVNTWTVIKKTDLKPAPDPVVTDPKANPIMVEIYKDITPATLAGLEATVRFKGLPYSNNLLTRVTDAEGRVTINEYDSAFRPEHPIFGDYRYRRVTKQWSTSGEDMVPILTAEYQYNPTGNPWLAGGNKVSLLIDKTRPENAVTTYVHKDGCLLYVAQPNAVGFSPANTNVPYVARYQWDEPQVDGRKLRRATENRDLRGLRTVLSYGTDGLLSATTSEGELTGEGGADSAVTNYFYNADRRLIKTVLPSPGDGRKTEVIYGTFPTMTPGVNREAGSNPARTDDFIYRHKPLSVARFAVTSPSRTSPDAPAASDKIDETRYTYVETVTAAAFARAMVGETRKLEFKGGPQRNVEGFDVSYDGRGYPTGKTTYTYATGPGTSPTVTETYAHDARGLMIQNVGPAGRMKRLAYDPLGRPISQEDYGSTSAQTPLAWDYSYYNQMGELIWKDGPRHAPEDYQFFDYDGAGRKIVEVTWKTKAKSDGIGVEADGYSIVNHYYDGFGNLIKTVDPLGNYALMGYDVMGRKIQSSSYNAQGVLLSTESFTYEPGSEVATHVDPLGGTTTKQYTMDGKPVSVTLPDGSSQSWTYYLDGRVKTHVLENQAVWDYSYDDLSLKETKILKLGGTVIDKKVTISDVLGKVVSEESFTSETASFLTTRQYDGLGRPVKETGPPVKVVGGETVSERQEKIYQYSFDTGTHTDAVTLIEGGGARVSKMVTDNLGREAYSEIRDGGGNLLQSSTKTYDPKHHFVKTTKGSDASVNGEETVYSNTQGKPVLWVLKDGKKRIAEYDKAGNNVRNKDEQDKYTLNEFDGLNRIKTKTYPDTASVEFGYDAASHLTRRTMPGGLVWNAVYNQKGQLDYEYLQQSGAATTRYFDYSYHPAGNPDVGLLSQVVEAETGGSSSSRNHTLSYDSRRRVSGKSSSGLGNLTVSSTLGYDFLGRPTLSTRTCRGTTSSLAREYDGYGQIYRETVSVGGVVQSQLNQKWNSLGMRTGLKKGADAPALTGATYEPDFTFDYYGNESLKGVSTLGGRYHSAYGYADNGLITSAELLDGSDSVKKVLTPLAGSYDSRGRLIGRDTYAGNVKVLTESVVRRGDSRISQYQLTRGNGSGGGWNTSSEQRNYGYNDRGKLTSESYLANPGAPSGSYVNENLTYGFDDDKIGFLTSVAKGGQTIWGAPKNPFARATAQTSNPALRTFQVKGTAHGPGNFALYVAAGTPTGPESYTKAAEFSPTPRSSSTPSQPNADWAYPLSLPPGSYAIQARARMTDHSERPYEAQSTPVSITVDGSQPIGYSVVYNSLGQVTTRSWGDGQFVQTLSWSADDRLETVTLSGGGDSYAWSAVYDPAGRRVKTSYLGAGETTPKEIRSWYDPEVEFLEIAVDFAGKRQWKLMGPDMTGAYGSAQGQGGCEAVIDEGSGVLTAMVGDISGNILGRVDTQGTATANDDLLVWNQLQISGYGVLPGFAPVSLEHSGDLLAAMNWQGRRLDPTGFYNMGTRLYDPESRRFLTADPLGHASSMDLYSYANGDPINHIDPDGRFARLVGDGISGLFKFGGEVMTAFREVSEFLGGSFMDGKFSANGPSARGIQMWRDTVSAVKMVAIPLSFMGGPLGVIGLGLDIGTSFAEGDLMGLATAGMGGIGRMGSAIRAETSLMRGGLSSGLSGGGRSFAGSTVNPWGSVANNVAGSALRINPTGGGMNCVNCAIATDSKLAGSLASAMPGRATPISVLEKTFGGNFQTVSGPMEIGSMLSEAGNGARGIVYGSSKTGNVGHVWNAINQNGTIRFLDGQSGAAGAKALGNFDDFANFRFLHTNP